MSKPTFNIAALIHCCPRWKAKQANFNARVTNPVACVALLLVVATHCGGQDDYRWTNPTGGTFNDSTPLTNWYNVSQTSYGGPPGTTDRALFEIAGASPYTIDFIADITVNSIIVRNSNQVHFDLGGHTLTCLTHSPYAGGIGVSGATLTIENGTIEADSDLGVGGSSGVSGAIIIGNDTLYISDFDGGGGSSDIIGSSSGFGSLTVTGTGSWIANTGIAVGFGGDGMLSIDNGGTVATSSVGFGTSADGSLTVSGTGSSLDVPFDIRFGSTGTSTAVIQNGGLVENRTGYIGEQPGSSGNVTVSGIGTAWNNAQSLQVRRGSLSVLDDGVVTAGGTISLGASGELTLDGGQVTAGTFRNTAGGTFNFYDGTLQVNGSFGSFSPGTPDFILNGNSASALPTLIISNTSTASLTGDLTVGDNYQGDLKILSGASMSNTNAAVGNAANSMGTVLVSGNGSQWSNNGQLIIGDLGHGSLTINDGGVVSNSGTDVGGINFVGRGIGSTGVVTVSGNGTQWNNAAALRVGSAGNGTLQIENGGVVNNTDGFIGFSGGSTGIATVTDEGSRWTNSGDLLVGGTGRDIGVGTLSIYDGGVVDVGGVTRLFSGSSISVEAAGILQTQTLDLSEGTFQMINGGVLMAETIVGDLLNESGVLAPGQSPGITTIDGDLIQGSSAILQVELGGQTSGLFDQLFISGNATWDGLLEVALFGDYSLGANQQYLIASIDGIQSGIFVGLGEGDLVGNFGGADLFISYAAGDGNDVALFTAVPEPATSSVWVLLAFGMMLRRRRAQGVQ